MQKPRDHDTSPFRKYSEAQKILGAGLLASFSILFFFHYMPVDAVDVTTYVTVSICGDALMSGPEVCDEGTGNNNGNYGSSTALRNCAPGCESFGPYCGDGILQVRFSEQCDDGNDDSTDLCTPACVPKEAAPQGGGGSPTVGSIPTIPGGVQGQTPSRLETRVVLRGKAYPGALVNVLLDGKILGTAEADVNADFMYSTADITAGTATFGFSAKDANGNDSITSSVVFEVVQSAITTVANVFFPPTLVVSTRDAGADELLTISGQTVPRAKVITDIIGGPKVTIDANADVRGFWALQLDTASISRGRHAAKAFFELGSTTRSGYGRSVIFTVGETASTGGKSPDLNKDGKVNLVDFSIFLISWNTDDYDPDFNDDGIVNLADFSIMLFAWTG